MYKYVWGNNTKRKTYKGRICKVLAKGRMNSICIEFENGERTITSRYAIRNMNKKLKFNQPKKLLLPDDFVSNIKFSPTTDESYIGKIVKPGYIRIVDNKVLFEPDGLEKPDREDFYSGRVFCIVLWKMAIRNYKASKQLVEVSNKTIHVLTKLTSKWILIKKDNRIIKGGEPCKAEVENDKTTIIELLT